MADETYSAKQVARRIGTDAKTFRKWLRSSSSPYPPVGQGKRYEFPVKELDHIKLHFNAWKNKAARKATVIKPNGHTKSIAEFGLGKVPPEKLTPKQFEAERSARQAARDEEYGTVDGEYPSEEDLLDMADELGLDDDALETMADDFEDFDFEDLDD